MDRTTIKATARHKLGETTQVFFTDTLLNNWCEDAQLDLVWKTKCKRTRAKFTTTALTESSDATQDIVRYTLTSAFPGCLSILDGGLRIYSLADNQWRKLVYISKDDLDEEYPNWEKQVAGTPIRYWWDRELNELLVFPSADSNHVGTNYAEGTYLERPDAIGSDSASPDIPEQLHPAVIDYCVFTGLESRGYQDIANTHRQFYNMKIRSYQTERERKEDEEIIMRPTR